MVITCLLASWYCRQRQVSHWIESPAEFAAQDRPLMTSYDAYRWLRHAREIRDGAYEPGTLDPLMSYPDGVPRLRPVPLLSVLLARLAPVFGGDIDWAGIYLVPLLASLFVIPLCLYFHRIGYPAAGILAAITGAFSEPYLVRTSVGRVDSDALNLCFPLLASLFVLLAAGGGRWRAALMAAAAGLTMLGFHWWYGHPGFALVYLATLVLHLAAHRTRVGTIALAAAAYVLCANPLVVFDGVESLLVFARVYLTGRSGDPGGFPDGTDQNTAVIPYT